MKRPLLPTSRRDRRLRRWLLNLLLCLLPLCLAWWWLGASDGFLRALLRVANLLLPSLVFEDLREIVWQPDRSWMVRTWLDLSAADAGSKATFFVGTEQLGYLVRGVPLLAALLLVTPGPKRLRLFLGGLAIMTLSLLGIVGHFSAQLAVLINHQVNMIDTHNLPPPFRVHAPAWPTWLFFLACLADYLARLILPLIGPVLIWVLLCPRELSRLVISLRRRLRISGPPRESA